MRNRIKTRALIVTLGTVWLALFVPPVNAQEAKHESKPNVIIINADDIGYGDVGAYGATKVKTPNIDRLAREGRMFTDAHSASAVCSPSRYALLTGEYPARANFWTPVFLRSPLVVDTSRMTIARLMKEAGYKTAAIGKWHLGFGSEEPVNWNKELKPGPLELGFDYYFGVPVLNSHPPFVYVENHNVVGLTSDDPMEYGKEANTRYFDEKFGLDIIGGGEVAHKKYEDRMVGTTLKDQAIRWVEQHKTGPFFLYFAPTNIHHPFTPAPQFIGTSEAGPYGDFVHELDWMVGEILTTLEEEELAENTLVIFTSDNGGMLNRGGQTAREAGHRQNGELLGFKFDAWEGGHRVPFIARWPGNIEPGTQSDELISSMDVLATLSALVEQPLEEGQGPDSYNILPALINSPDKPIRDHLIISPAQEKNLAIRKGKWMYISGQGGGGFSEKNPGDHSLGGPAAFPFTGQENSDIIDCKIKEGAPPAQLYNMEADPWQTTNLYNKYPEKVNELSTLLEKTLQN